MLSRPFPVNGTTKRPSTVAPLPARAGCRGRNGRRSGRYRSIQRTKTPAVRPGLLPLYFRRVFAYADSDVLRNSETKAVRSGVQTMRRDVPAGVAAFPFQSIVVACPLCGEQRRYLPQRLSWERLIIWWRSRHGRAKVELAPSSFSSMALGWLTLSVECLFRGRSAGVRRPVATVVSHFSRAQL